MTPRRKQFFRMVSEGLKVGFEGEDLSRVENFVRYCKKELDFEPQGPLHQVGQKRAGGSMNSRRSHWGQCFVVGEGVLASINVATFKAVGRLVAPFRRGLRKRQLE